MRYALIALIMFLATCQGIADTSREDKVAHIIEIKDFRGQIVAYGEEVTKRSIEELNNKLQIDLDEKVQKYIKEEMENIFEEIVEGYIRDVADVYMENLAENEIDAVYKFYRSPEGMSFGSKLPAIGRKIFWINARYLELISERAVSRITERLSREGYKLN